MVQNPLNASELTFPVFECIHIVGFALTVGTISLVDFRLLGFGMKKQTAAELAKDTGLWTLTGLVVMLFSGLMLFSSDPGMYYLNISFDLKMFFLVLAIVFHYTFHRKAVARASTGGNRMVACTSLALWIAVVFGGIFIGFVNSTLDLNRI
jgi:hypothetical protein